MKSHFTTILFICLFALSAFISPLIMTGCGGDDDGGLSVDNGLDGGGDGNKAPTDISLSNDTVDEHTDTSGGYSVGKLTTSDEDSGESFSYSVVGGADAGVFTIGGAGSDELILTDGVLDFETQSSYEVIVEVTDSGANTYQETLTVTVNDLDEIIKLDFDDGTLQGWTADGLWHITTNRYSSPPNSIWYADEATGNFDTGDANAGGVTSPIILLGASASLDFEYFLESECQDPGYVCDYDNLTVEISLPDGSWTVLENLPEADVFTPVTIDVSAYANLPVRLRFYFDTYDEIDNALEGAYVDNVVITDAEILPEVALFANTTYVDYIPGSNVAEASNLEAGLTEMGREVVTFTGITGTDINTAVADADILVIPELQNGDLNAALDASARTAIADFVSNGGALFTFCDFWDRMIPLLNATFSFSLVQDSLTEPYNLNATDAAGTIFANGPASLPWLSDTFGLTAASLPAGAKVIYEETSGTDAAVVAIPYGDGFIVVFGWDWFDAAPVGSADGGWLEVLYWAMWVNHYGEADAVARGWWNDLGDHTSTNDNTWTGYDSIAFYTTNSYFIFDLSDFAGDVTWAMLRLEVEDYISPDASETLTVYDVSTDAMVLEADGTGETAIYNDLETGTVYGTFEVEAADVGDIIEIPLSDGAIDDINTAAGGSFSVGIHLDSLSVSPSTDEGVRFSLGSEARTHQLMLVSF